MRRFSQLEAVENDVNTRSNDLGAVNSSHQAVLEMASGQVSAVKEQILGTFDLFPAQFGIANTSNFSFSAPTGSNWYCFEAQDGAFLCRPLDGAPDTSYEIVRLTTTVTPRLSASLFAQGHRGTTQYDDAKAT